jgi:DNA-binding NarL/FixJ family response regulator
MMSLLLTRDWRTRVVGEATNRLGMAAGLRSKNARPDLILLDTEMPGNPSWPYSLAEEARARPATRPLASWAMGTQPDWATLQKVLDHKFDGYVIEREVQYGLAEAVYRAAQGEWVVTPGASDLGQAAEVHLPARQTIIDGRRTITDLTGRES